MSAKSSPMPLSRLRLTLPMFMSTPGAATIVTSSPTLAQCGSDLSASTEHEVGRATGGEQDQRPWPDAREGKATGGDGEVDSVGNRYGLALHFLEFAGLPAPEGRPRCIAGRRAASRAWGDAYSASLRRKRSRILGVEPVFLSFLIARLISSWSSSDVRSESRTS